jgi:acyl-CoA synthetase (AMP-forming)/AMP-acid ligase II
MLMRGYLTPSGLADADDWLDTGDLGYLDDQGYLHVERERPSITLGGAPVSPRAVEDLALDHPFVADAAACVWDTPTGGQRVALVVERRGETVSSLEALRAQVIERHGFAEGFSVHELERLPRRASGKVDGLAVRRLLVDGQA